MRRSSRILTIFISFAFLSAAITTEEAFQNAADAAVAASNSCVDILLGKSTTQADLDNLADSNLGAEVDAIGDALKSLSKNGNLRPATPSCAAVLPVAKLYFEKEIAQGFCMQGIACTKLAQKHDKAEGVYNYEKLHNRLLQLNTQVPQLQNLLNADCSVPSHLYHTYLAAYNQTQLAIDRLNPQVSPNACIVPPGEGPPFENDG